MVLPPFYKWLLCIPLICITKASASDVQVATSSLLSLESSPSDEEFPMALFMSALTQPTPENEPEKEDLPKTAALNLQATQSKEPEDASDCSECSNLSDALADGADKPTNTAADTPNPTPEQVRSPEVSQAEA